MFKDDQIKVNRIFKLKVTLYVSYLFGVCVFFYYSVELLGDPLSIVAIVFNVTGMGYLTCAITNSKYARLSKHVPYSGSRDHRLGEFLYGLVALLATSIYFTL
ncbi:hypothetical protein [Aliikangiella sp. IMCC44632]